MGLPYLILYCCTEFWAGHHQRGIPLSRTHLNPCHPWKLGSDSSWDWLLFTQSWPHPKHGRSTLLALEKLWKTTGTENEVILVLRVAANSQP